MSACPRVALFSDSHYEANGVARTTIALEQYAARHEFPLLSVHAGPDTHVERGGSITRVELRRAEATSFPLEHDLRFDLAFWRHASRVAGELIRFKPDVLHVTGPSDVGQIGMYLGWRLGIPIVGSWHTNLHEYAARRLMLGRTPEVVADRIRRWVEAFTLRTCVLFYRLPRVILAANEELVRLLAEQTRRPTFLMTRGVDCELFNPAFRSRIDSGINVGYVGRLSREKSVRRLAALEQALLADGHTHVRFTIVGDGCERGWLGQHMRTASFTGVLKGPALAAAYADMDLFVFPSETETVGNVVLEAMASGVPVVAMAHGGPKFIANDSAAAVLADDEREFVGAVRALVRNRSRRLRMGAAARTIATGRSWDRIFSDVYRAYGLAVAAGQGGTAWSGSRSSSWERVSVLD
jgi:phosphatidylinositol alpha 1,6-mannosyltransferase